MGRYFKNDAEPTVQPMPPPIASALVMVLGAVKRLAKDNNNSHGNYKYTSVDDFYSMLGPTMAEAGIIIKPVKVGSEVFEVQSRNGARRMVKLRYKFRIIHTSGAMWTDDEDIREVDVDHTGAQSYGAAESYALKMYERSLFQIATGEDDADAGAQLDAEVQRAKVKAIKAEAETKEDHTLLDMGDGLKPIPISQVEATVKKHLIELGDAKAINEWVRKNEHGRATLHAAHKGLAVRLKGTIEQIVRGLTVEKAKGSAANGEAADHDA